MGANFLASQTAKRLKMKIRFNTVVKLLVFGSHHALTLSSRTRHGIDSANFLVKPSNTGICTVYTVHVPQKCMNPFILEELIVHVLAVVSILWCKWES